MEEILNKLVNLAIGAVKSADENLQDAISRVEGEVSELIAKGEASTDDNSAAVKQFVDDALTRLTEVQSQVQSRTDEAYATIKPSIDKAVEFVQGLSSQVTGGSDAGETAQA